LENKLKDLEKEYENKEIERPSIGVGFYSEGPIIYGFWQEGPIGYMIEYGIAYRIIRLNWKVGTLMPSIHGLV